MFGEEEYADFRSCPVHADEKTARTTLTTLLFSGRHRQVAARIVHRHPKKPSTEGSFVVDSF